jgi:lipoprotein-releasing system ATP-binding protein
LLPAAQPAQKASTDAISKVALVAESIGKTYPARGRDLVILRDASLHMRAGESAAIVGPSGSGKSTFLNILGTLEPPTSGTLTINGVTPARLSEPELARFRNQTIGFIFQEHHLLPQCTVLENVLLPTLAARRANARAVWQNSTRGDSLQRARELIEAVGLADRMDHRPAELSGGERQRVAIARALIQEPSLVLADEPTGNLDRSTAETIGDLLLKMAAGGMAMLVVVTHSEALASRMPRRFEINNGALAPR